MSRQRERFALPDGFAWLLAVALGVGAQACRPLLLVSDLDQGIGGGSSTGGGGSTGGGETWSHRAVRTDYVESPNDVPNAERGFVNEYRQGSILPRSLPLVIYRVDWGDYCNAQPLPSAAISALVDDFNAFRAAHLKCIFLISYALSGNINACGFFDPASADVAVSHLQALKPILAAHKDVIAMVEAGIMGRYGTWVETGDGTPATTQASNPPNLGSDPAKRLQIVTALLDAVPVDRKVLLPDAAYRASLVGAVDTNRLGFQNNGFMATETDGGTYPSAAARPTVQGQINAATLTVPFGGETGFPNSNQRWGCANAVTEMAYLRPTFLNRQWYPASFTTWQNEGCFSAITNRLGYRFVVQQVDYTSEASPGDLVTAQVTLLNTGYAPLYNPHQASLMLEGSNGAPIVAPSMSSSNTDATAWMPGQLVVLSQTLRLPADLPAGSYAYTLSIAAPSEASEYAVRLASDAPGEVEDPFRDGRNALRISVVVK